MSVIIRRMVDEYIDKSPTVPPTGESPPNPQQAEPDRAELVELLDTALGMTKAKDIKPLLEKIRERLTK